jgi:urease accessory protein
MDSAGPAPPSDAPAFHLDAASLLTLSRWLSPAFPTGAFGWSHGLEWAVRAGEVRDVTTLEGWLDALLRHGAGRGDAILLHAAYGAGDDLPDIADLALGLSSSRERRAETWAQGSALAGTLRAVEGLDLPDMALPVALGRAARLGGLLAAPVALVMLQATVTNLAQAAQRLMPLGQTDAQRVLLRLAPACAAVAAEAATATLDDLGSCAFALDIASMRHETMEPRLFRS